MSLSVARPVKRNATAALLIDVPPPKKVCIDVDKASMSLAPGKHIILADICAGMGTGALAMHEVLDRHGVHWTHKVVCENEKRFREVFNNIERTLLGFQP